MHCTCWSVNSISCFCQDTLKVKGNDVCKFPHFLIIPCVCINTSCFCTVTELKAQIKNKWRKHKKVLKCCVYFCLIVEHPPNVVIWWFLPEKRTWSTQKITVSFSTHVVCFGECPEYQKYDNNWRLIHFFLYSDPRICVWWVGEPFTHYPTVVVMLEAVEDLCSKPQVYVKIVAT